MKTFSALLALWEGNLPVTGGFPSQISATRSFDVCFDQRLNKRLSNTRDAGDLRHHHAHYDATVMLITIIVVWRSVKISNDNFSGKLATVYLD